MHTTIRPSDEEIAKTAGILNEPRKVTIFGGAGCAGAHTELMELAGKLKAPIVYALRGKEFIEYDNPFDVGMLLGDLLSLRQLDLPVKMIVFNNSALAFVELEMKAAGMLDFATGLRNPDFAKLAEAADVLGLRANAPEQVRPLLAQALSHPGPALVEVVVDRQELALPPSIKLDQVKGFSLFMMKAVIDGRGSEVIDLLKTSSDTCL
jgi:pyruvate dehydrogenase (quinone)